MLRKPRPPASPHSIFLFLPILFALCLSLLFGSALAAVSLPRSQGWVTDQAGLLDPSTRARLEQLLTEVERKSGVEIAVVTLQTLDGKPIEQAGVELFNAWGIGKKGKDEGILLLIAPNERKLRIEVGYGLEEAIPDGLAGEIIRETITPRFRQGRFAEGIETGVGQIVKTVARHKGLDLVTPHAPSPRPAVKRLSTDERRLISRATLFFLLVLVGLIGIALAGERSARGRRGTRGLRRRFWGVPISPPGGGWSGGGFGSSGSGGFGGFGGGSSGGGGASGGW